MLSQELRPKTLDDMAGQEEAKKLIKAIIKNPEKAPKVLLFCGSFGTGKCVSKGTRVHTNKGYLKIEDIVDNPSYDNDGFMSISNSDIRVLGGNLATHHYYGGNKKVIQVSSKEFSISGTQNHRVRVFDNDGLSWKRLDRITTDDYVAIPKNDDILFSSATKEYSFFNENVSEFDKGYFCGSVVSYLLINKRYVKSLDDIINVHTDNSDINDYISSIVRSDCYNEGIIHGDGIKDFIIDNGFNIDTIPENVFSSNKEYIKGFISSLFDFLGVSTFGITKLTKSIAIDIQNLLSLYGCINSIKNLYGNRAEIDIELTDSRYFILEELNLKNKTLLSQYRDIVDRGCDEYIPNNLYTRDIARYINSVFIDNYKGDIPFSAYRSIKNTFNFIKNYRNKIMKVEHFQDILDGGDICSIDLSRDSKVEKFRDLLSKYHFSKVSKIVDNGVVDIVYDLTVENIHSFIANGIINHNTTSSRIVGRELNGIKDEDYDLLNSPFYYEFDSTVVGNVEKIRELRDIFTVEYGDYWRVVTLDEVHTVSSQAQAAMLKMFEETKGKTIYILATTDPQKLLPTIRSRALEINFNDVPVEAIVENLTRVSDERGLNLSDEIKLLIADRSGGHMRNAHMLLDKYLLLGEEDFRDSIKSSITLFCDYLIAVYNNDKDTILNTINELLSIPKDNLQSDWSIVMTESLRSYCGFDCRHKDIQRLVDTYKGDFNIIAQCYMSTWVKNMFVDTPYTQATLLNLYKVVRGALDKKKQQSAVGVQSNVGRYGKPVR
jgi:DNA polymerase III, gamma and tau subunit